MNYANCIKKLTSDYLQHFAERGGITPTDPLEFHFYHLARYWSRLTGFCRQASDTPEGWIESDLGACVEVGTKFANESIDANSPNFKEWKSYMEKVNGILHSRPVSLQDVENASLSFENFLSAINYDPWADSPSIEHPKPQTPRDSPQRAAASHRS